MPYSGDVECAWKLIADPSISTSIDLSIDLKSKCSDEYIIVHKGPSYNYPHTRFCQKFSTKNLTNMNSLYIEYYSSRYNSDSAFNVTVVPGSDCGGFISEPFRSINFRDIYQNNMECIWDIQAKDGHHISLNFTGRFFIEDSSDCSKDYLIVQDKIKGEWKNLTKLCGRNPPGYILESSGRNMRLIFRSDNENTADGFTAQFSSSCGGILYTSDSPISVRSFQFPSQQSRRQCNYTIINPSYENILVDFDYYSRPYNSLKCERVNLTVTRFNWSYSDQLKETFCNSLTAYEIRSGNKLQLLFNGPTPLYSFSFRYSKDTCGGLVTAPTTIRSPVSKNDGFHPQNMKCFWNITAPEGKKILIKFIKLDMEYHSECIFDNVQVYNGKNVALEQRMVNLCGNISTNVPTISVPSRYAVVKSASDDTTNSRGFVADIKFVENCDDDILLGMNNLTTHLFIGGYKNSMDCNLKIRGPNNYKLQITFESMHVEDCEGCDCDFLEVYDGMGPFGDLIGKFCGHTLPSPIITTKHAAFLRFVSDDNMPSNGINFTVAATLGECGSNGQIKLDEDKVNFVMKCSII